MIDADDEVLVFFKTLVDADRLRMAGMLGMEPLSVEQLAERLGLRPSQVANHLARLEQAGLVKQKSRVYSLDTNALEALSRRVLAGKRQKVDPESLEGDEYDRKVLSDFLLPDGRLKDLPMQNKKLMVVLRHVLQVFEPGAYYPEKQVNDMLLRFHEDTASLRRYLVDYRMVQREKGVYWRPEERENPKEAKGAKGTPRFSL